MLYSNNGCRKRNMLLCTITAAFEMHRLNWETFFPDKSMKFVIPVILNKDHRRRVFSVYALTQARSENEIVDASSSSPNTIPRSKDRVACMPVVDLVSTSSERLIESIESDRLDIKSPLPEQKQNVN